MMPLITASLVSTLPQGLPPTCPLLGSVQRSLLLGVQGGEGGLRKKVYIPEPSLKGEITFYYEGEIIHQGMQLSITTSKIRKSLLRISGQQLGYDSRMPDRRVEMRLAGAEEATDPWIFGALRVQSPSAIEFFHRY